MFAKKVLLANVLSSINLLNVFKRLPLKNKLIILNYHRIRPDKGDFRPVFDQGVYNISASQFALQVKWLKQNSHILGEDDLIGHFYENRPIGPGTMITFDDGYIDNYTLAYPILKAYNAPAFFFIPTKIIETRELGWWDIIAYIIKNSPKETVSYQTRHFDLTGPRDNVITFFLEKMKREPYQKTKRLIYDLSELFEVDLPSPDIQDRQLMTWEQVKEVTDIVTIGSHTHSHRVLATLDPILQKEEMVLSRIILSQKTGKDITSIAYPVGGADHYTNESLLIAKEAGYRLGFTSGSGVNTLTMDDPFSIRRVNNLLEDVRTVAAFVILPDIFLWEKAEKIHKRVLSEHPDYADFAYRMGLIQMAQGRIEDAMKSFSDALSNNPRYAEARIKLAICQAYKQDFESARKNLEEVLSNHPGYADVHYLLGIIHSLSGRIAKALDSFENALKINPEYKDARIKLSILCIKIGMFEKGINELEKAAASAPENEELAAALFACRSLPRENSEDQQERFRVLKEILLGSEDYSEGVLREFMQHIEISPNISDMLTIITNFSDKDEAARVLLPLLEDYIRQYPTYPDLRNVYGMILFKLDRLEEAEAAFKKALQLSPRYLKARFNLFRTHLKAKKYRLAFQEGLNLAEKRLPYPDLYTDIAEALINLSDLPRAEEYLKKALSINPDYPKAKRLMEKIKKGT